MSQAKLTPRAQSDVNDIWNYSAATWGVDQAEVYLRQIMAAIEIVTEKPLLGRSCDRIRTGYRNSQRGLTLLFYKSEPDGVHIIRILHQRMDIENSL